MEADQEPGVDPQTDGQEPPDGQTPQDTFDRSYVEKLRAESASYRTRARDAEQKLAQFNDYDDLKAAAAKWQELEDKNKSELEKVQDQLSQLQAERDLAIQQAQDQKIRSAFVAEASKLGFANPEDAYRLASLDNVVIDDDGTVSGVAKAVKALEGRLPMAKTPAPSVDGGAGGSARGGKATPTEAEIREMAAMLNVSVKHLGEVYGVTLKD